MRTFQRATLMALAGAALSCTSPAAPGEPPVTGVIVARDLSTSIGAAPSMHVKDAVDDECGVIYLARPSTQVFRRTTDGRTVDASPSELTVGRHVGVWADVVLESCPGQSVAKAVVILE